MPTLCPPGYGELGSGVVNAAPYGDGGGWWPYGEGGTGGYGGP